MTTQTLAFAFNDFKAALSIGICLMVLVGWILNLRAKNRIGDAGRLLASGEFGRDSEQEFGEILGVERFQSVQGLAGYPPPTLWQRIFGGGAAMELIFTQSALIFCEPSATSCVKRTSVSLEDVVSVRTDYNNGSTLIIKVSFGTIRCESQGTLGAKPAKKILDGILSTNRTRV